MLVSVIIPAYNVSNYITQCLESVLNQTHKEIEIICVDDGSKDDTKSILLKYAAQYPRIIQIISQQNSGAPVARNNGFSVANGEYIQFLDADDFLMPEKIKHQLELLTKSGTKADLIAGGFKWIINGNLVSPPISLNNVWMDLIRGSLGITSSNLWKKSCLNDVGGWGKYVLSSQETDLMFRMLATNPIVVYDVQPLTRINVRATGSISTINRSENFNRFINIRLCIINYLKKNNLISAQLLHEYYKIVFNTIRLLYFHNPQKGVWYYNEIFPHGASLKYLNYSSYVYKFFFFLFGFRRTETLSTLFKKHKARQ